MNVGFIGLGRMGRAMAVNLGKAGHHVRAWNRTREVTADLAAKGLSIVGTPDEAFAGDAVISMLGDDTAVRAVFLEGGLLGRTSTSPDAVARVQPLLDALGARTWNAGDTPSHANLMKLAANLLLASTVETGSDQGVFDRLLSYLPYA